MKINEIKNLDYKSLNEKLLELKKELIKINAQIAIGTTPKNPGQVKNIKKTIARIMGIKKEKVEGTGKSQISKFTKGENLEVVEKQNFSGTPHKNSGVKKKHE